MTTKQRNNAISNDKFRLQMSATKKNATGRHCTEFSSTGIQQANAINQR